MLTAIARGDSVHVGSVRCRGGRDALRERRCFEAAMGDVSGASVGLPVSALLFVRRIAPSTPLRDAKAEGFADAVRTELGRVLRAAGRPWLQAAAASAEAVLFLDEAELAACLIRDWLQGCVRQRWWWQGILGSTTVLEWLRREVIERGEMFAAVTETLSASGHAVEWYVRIEPARVLQAQAALDVAYGVSATPASVGESAAGPAEETVLVRRADAGRSGRYAAALQMLRTAAPEIASGALSVERRRLLATALCVRRRLHWTRSPEFADALQALREREVMVPGMAERAAPLRPEAATSVSAAPADAEFADASTYAALPDQARSGRGGEPAAVSNPVDSPSAGLATQGQPAAAAEAPYEPTINAPGPESRAAVPSPAAIHPPPPGTTGSLVTTLPAENAVDPAATRSYDAAGVCTLPRDEVRELLPQCVQTHFGGIFYLLNVALALGLYGDFTAPRARGLDLSPWDWLAAIGRRWFGSKFRADPIWALLAQLAGHPPRARPECDFEPPPDWVVPPHWLDPYKKSGRRRSASRSRSRAQTSANRWFALFLEYLTARLSLALDERGSRRVRDLVCRYEARIAVSASTVDVHMTLAELLIAIRQSGLDRDPGWIPAAGRSLRFHFQ